VDQFGDRTAYRTILQDGFGELSYDQVLGLVMTAAEGMKALGVARGDRIAILSDNRPEWSQADYAAICSGVPVVPIHTTLTPAQIAYILEDSGSKVVFASTEDQLEKALEAIASLEPKPKVVVFDPPSNPPSGLLSWQDFMEGGGRRVADRPEADFRKEALSVEPEDPATIIYTSGTTGTPKGVVLTHNNFYADVKATTTAIHIDEFDATLSFLPLSHVLQRMADYVFFSRGATITYARSIRTVAEDLGIAKPTKVVAAPRLYEKFYQAVMEQPGLKRWVVRWAREVGEAWAEEKLAGREPTLVLRLVYKLAYALVFKKIHQAVGGRLVYFISGGAPLAPHINKFFYSAGILILEGYGLTETSPILTANTPDDFQVGTVGTPIPGTEIRIAEDGEILVRGPQVMKGYFNRPDETSKALDSEKWLKTGDLGEIDENGHLRITDRKKNILVTAGGKNIAPAPIENLIKENRYVDQVVMIGDRRHFPSLLVVPSFEPLEGWAKSRGVQFTCRQSLLENAQVKEHMGEEVLGLLGDLASFECPKKLGLIKEEFTIEGGILTPNQKVKRRVVHERYGPLISQFYDPGNRDVAVFVEPQK
jgi:long-chain acyl-CoA synthetase